MDMDRFKPSYCVWELTLACNLRCGHCGSRAGKARPDELETSEALGVVKSLAKLGCEVITLSGGEPTLRSDWATIAKAIRDHGMIPNLVSNGYELDEKLAGQMKEAGLANVAISIDGPKDVHDRVRGRGTFAVTRRSLEILKNTGIPTTVMTTICALNLSRLEEVHDFAVGVGARRWRCQLGKPMGNLKTNDDWVIKPGDLLTLLPALHRLAARGQIQVGIGDSIGYYGAYDVGLRALSWKGQPQRWAGCQAGMRAIGIEANGGIKGCLSMQAFSGGPDPFLEGNIRERSLESIWFDPKAFSYNRQFSPDSLTGFCKKCRHAVNCRGGARCVAAAATGSVSEDPYCYHRVAALANSSPARLVKRHLATAASVASLLFVGCADYTLPQGNGPVDCEEVCCECGPDEVPADVYQECCESVAPDYGVEPINCEEFCCDCEYGDMPIPPDVYEECCDTVTPDYGTEPVNCEEVCCECDYGELPPGVWEECCDDDEP